MKELEKEETKAEDEAENVMKDPNLLPEIFDGISSENPSVKFKSAKILRIISERNPQILYSRMDFFVNLLDSENNILKWIAIDVIGNLTPVDSENKFDKMFKKY